MAWYSESDFENSREAVQRKIDKRRERGDAMESFAPPQHRTKIVETFWGRAWCHNLETCKDYEHRLPRGRSYLRQGSVYNLEIERGVITAEVAGSDLYDVRVAIRPIANEEWADIRARCAGETFSLLDLLTGKLGDHVMRVITEPGTGLLPRPQDLKLICSCPDYADLCKHLASVLYAVGVLFDRQPELLFQLRGVDPASLVETATAAASETATGPAGEVIDDGDLSAIFGIDLASDETPARPESR